MAPVRGQTPEYTAAVAPEATAAASSSAAAASAATAAPARIALVEDHQIVAVGFRESLRSRTDLEVVAIAATVDELAPVLPLDLVVLDLRLADGSQPAENIRRIRDTGAGVVILTAADDVALIRLAAREGVLAILRKSESVDAIVDAIHDAAFGETIATTEWAAALDADAHLADAGLSRREREILGLYASGERAQDVADITGLSPATVANYVVRIRAKYERVGRPAPTKVDLHRRAAEDGLLAEGR